MAKHRVDRTLAAVIAALVLALLPGAAFAQAVVQKLNAEVPLSFVLTPADFPCLTEDIAFDGTLHTVQVSVFDAAGGRNIKVSFNSPDFFGIGATSGIEYRASGPSHFSFTDADVTNPPREVTFLDVFHIVGEGTAANIWASTQLHVTRDASGRMTATVVVSRLECQ